MKHGSGAVRRSTPATRPTTAEPTAPHRRRAVRLAAAAGLGLVAAMLAVSLSGCGIRDTAVPVDAGDPASRTACPPSPDATLTQLEADAGILPTAARPAPTAGPAAGRVLLPQATVSPVPQQVAPSPTESDGSLSCLHPDTSTSGSGGGSTSAPTDGPTRSPAAESARASAASDAPDGTKDTSGATAP